MEKYDWYYPVFSGKEKDILTEVINSGYINDGKYTRDFEEKIANLLNVKYCVAVTSGTAALSISLYALGVRSGDEVIVPNFTFIATANAVSMIGAKPIFVDVEQQTLLIDTDSIVDKITNKTKAIITVDVNGRGCNYEKLEQIALQYNLSLISDSAEALGSKHNGKYLGTFGDAGCFSFSPNKTITTGQGGMIATNNDELYIKLLELKDQGRSKQGTGGDDPHPVIGFNFKLTNLQSSVGLVQVEELESRLKHSKNIENWYKKLR